MNFSKILILFSVIMLEAMPFNVEAQKVETFLDSSSVELASPVTLSLKVSANRATKVIFPTFKQDFLIPDLEFFAPSKTDTISTGISNVDYVHHIYITSYSDSSYTIPRLAVIVGNDTLFSDSLKVSFTLLRADSSFTKSIDTSQVVKIFDIVTVKDAPWTFKEFWSRFGKYILFGLTAALIAALIIYLVIRYKRNLPVIGKPRPKEPAHIAALRELQSLKDENLWQNGHTKAYYSKLTDIVKLYISNRYSASVMELTTGETLTAISKFWNADSQEFIMLKYILETADPVKFAKTEPLPDENFRCMENALAIVENTKIVPVEQSENISDSETATNVKKDQNV